MLLARPKKASVALVGFSAPVAIAIALFLWWNWTRFGSPMQTGSLHQKAMERWFSLSFMTHSVPAQLASLQRGVLIFSPPILLACAGWAAPMTRQRRLGIFALGVVVSLAGFYSSFRLWTAPASWGPRFLAPLLLLPLAAWLHDLDRSQWKRRAILALAEIGFMIQLTVVEPGYLFAECAAYWVGHTRAVDLFLRSDIVPQAVALISGRADFWWLSGVVPGLAGAALFVWMAAGGIGLIRRVSVPPSAP